MSGKYEINIISNEDKDINDIFIKLINKNLQKLLLQNCINNKNNLYLDSTYLSSVEKEDNN